MYVFNFVFDSHHTKCDSQNTAHEHLFVLGAATRAQRTAPPSRVGPAAEGAATPLGVDVEVIQTPIGIFCTENQ